MEWPGTLTLSSNPKRSRKLNNPSLGKHERKTNLSRKRKKFTLTLTRLCTSAFRMPVSGLRVQSDRRRHQ